MRGKYLLLLNNQIRFDSHNYHEEAIVMESRIRWITLSTKMQFQYPFVVSMTDLQLQDMFANLDDLTEL